MAFERLLQLARLRVPQTHLVRRGRERSSVRRERGGVKRTVRDLNPSTLRAEPAALRVEEDDGATVRVSRGVERDGERAPVGREGDWSRAAAEVLRSLSQTARLRVPESDGLIVAAARENFSVGREGDSVNFLLVRERKRAARVSRGIRAARVRHLTGRGGGNENDAST